jgi:digeranylgeranylglycerophospholipid reductase
MKVAIIGGGFSGLACAHELERLGVSPDIYEKRESIGEPISHVTADLEMSHRPVRDALDYFRECLNIRLEPLERLKTIVHFSPHVKTVVKGNNLGYLLENTSSPLSIKKQLLRDLKTSRIILNTEAHPLKLKKDYDYIAVATGNYIFPNEFGLWQEWLQCYVRGALVYGSFDPGALLMWLNKDYCKNGYAYLAPFDKDRAALILIVTDINEREIDHYWDLFIYSENLGYSIGEQFKLEHRAGFVYPRIIENMMMIGNAGGGLDPFLGFGLFNSLVSGVSAARAIAAGFDYEKQIKKIMNRNKDMREFRKVFNTMTNRDYDNLLTAMKFPGFRSLAYNFPVGINFVRIGGAAVRLLLKREQLGR